MSIRPHPTKGPGWWYINYRPEGRKGKQKNVAVEGTEAEAMVAETRLRRQNRGRKISAFPQLKEAAPDFITSYELDHQPAGTDRTRRSLKILLKFFGKELFTSITHGQVDLYKEKRLKEGVVPSTINKELAALSSFCKWGAERGFCQPVKIKRFPPKLTRAPFPNVPSQIEMLALINSMDWPKCGLFACLYLGGLRSAEAINLKAETILMQQGVMLVIGKGNKERVVPIIPSLKPILEKRLKEIQAGLMWPKKDGTPCKDLRSAIKWASKRAGITRHINPHLFRHAFGVHTTESGVNLRQLQQVMGHSSSTTTELYSRLAAEALKKELGKFSTPG
jgi:site-specific recombinase XerD